MAFQLEVRASRRNWGTADILWTHFHKGIHTFSHPGFTYHISEFQINPIVRLAVILAWFPKERGISDYIVWVCLFCSPLFSNNCTLRISIFQSETGYGEECPSVSSFSCSKIICCESYKKWFNYNTKQTNIRKKKLGCLVLSLDFPGIFIHLPSR